MGQNEPIRKNTHASGHHGPASEIPDKLYFRIGEVASLCEVPAYVLRFWETEFPQLKPNKGGTGQRLYRRRDVEMALRVKRLLYDEGYTIPGARQLLKTELRHKEPQLPLLGPGGPDVRKLEGLRRELEAIAAMLSRPVVRPHGDALNRGPDGAKTLHPIRSTRRSGARAGGPTAVAPARGPGGVKSEGFSFEDAVSGCGDQGE
jgi:DNA-binding transcriptional MerR regulator